MASQEKRASVPARQTAETAVPVELGYCPRCGALRVHPPGQPQKACGACARVLRWSYEEVSDEATEL